MARRRKSNRRRRGSFGFLYKLLSVLVICGAIVAALTLFFRWIPWSSRGSSGIRRRRSVRPAALPRERTWCCSTSIPRPITLSVPCRILKKFPSTASCRIPCSFRYGSAAFPWRWCRTAAHGWSAHRGRSWISRRPRRPRNMHRSMAVSCWAPSVGTRLALATEYTTQQSSLLSLLAALENRQELEHVDAIHLGDPTMLTMDYDGRFTIQLSYGADYDRKLPDAAPDFG